MRKISSGSCSIMAKSSHSSSSWGTTPPRLLAIAGTGTLATGVAAVHAGSHWLLDGGVAPKLTTQRSHKRGECQREGRGNFCANLLPPRLVSFKL